MGGGKSDCYLLYPDSVGTTGATCAGADGTPEQRLCALGHVCGSTSVCARYCELNGPNTCPSGQSCGSFASRPIIGSSEIGLCR